MADKRIQYTEEVVGNGHPTKADTLNRLTAIEHNADGTHPAQAISSGGGILHSLATAANDFLVASGAGVFVKQTLAQVKTLLGLVLTQTAAAVGFTLAGGTSSKTLTVLQDVTLESSTDLYPIHEITEFSDDHTAAGLNLLDDADAAAQRATLGLGTIATQAANNVAITGGAISGITGIAIADGGTSASTAAGARTALGVAIGADVMAYEAWPIHEIDELCSVD